jgi:hydrogenase maturation protease
MEERSMKILILGMGNPILSDDGVGLLLAERVGNKITGADVAVNPMIGLTLLDQILGYDRVFIIDAMTSSGGTVGTTMVISESDGHGSLHLFSSHGINIFSLMDFGRESGFDMPELAAVYGIEIGREVAFGCELTPALRSQIEAIEQGIIEDMVSREPSLSIST